MRQTNSIGPYTEQQEPRPAQPVAPIEQVDSKEIKAPQGATLA